MSYFFSLPEEKKAAVVKRFWEKVDKNGPNGCHIWTGPEDRYPNPYGKLGVDIGKSEQAHRLAWMIHYNTDIPKGLFCCHACDVRLCVRPDHIFLGTVAQNNKDSRMKDRQCKIKLPLRLQIASDVKSGMLLREVITKYNIKSDRSVRNYLKDPFVVAIMGKIDIRHRMGGWQRWKKINGYPLSTK